MAIIDGTEGDDDVTVLTGTAEDDVISGLGGDDQLRGQAGDDTLDGGDGFDQARYESSPGGIVLTFNAGNGTYSVEDGFGFTDTLMAIERIRGSNNDDEFIGGAGDDSFVGNGGDDLFTGGGGFDNVFYTTSPAGVTVNLDTGLASDGFGGTDTLVDIDLVVGSIHDDVLIGSDDPNLVDTLRGWDGDDFIDGGGGDFDEVSYTNSPKGATVNLLQGVAKNDGFGSTDTIVNIEGIEGSLFADKLTGDGNDNTIDGRGGKDTIDGGGGFDLVEFNQSSTGVFVDLGKGTATGYGAKVKLISIEGVIGSDSIDNIIGNNDDNFFFGGAGSDFFDGRGGDDFAGYDGDSDDFDIALVNGVVTVEDVEGDIDSYVNVEFLEFDDVTVATADLLV